MKTKNNIRKAAIMMAAAAAGIAMIGLTVNAQMSSYFENTGNNTMAMVTEKTITGTFATLVNTKTLAKTNALSVFYETETEVPLYVEDWMLNEKTFSAMFSIETETEPALEIEDWMIKEINIGTSFLSIETVTEEGLSLENWMVDENNFEVKEKAGFDLKETQNTITGENYIFSEETDFGKLQVEAWMLNSKIWRAR